MFELQDIRQFDRALSRIFQNFLVNDDKDFPKELCEKLVSALKGIELKDPIDITKYNATQLIKVDYFINKYLLESMLLNSSDSTLTLPTYQLKISAGVTDTIIEIQPKPAHGHIGQFFLKHKQFVYDLYTMDSDLPYKQISEFLNQICEEDVNKERAIGKMMLAFFKQGFCFWNEEHYNSKMVNLDLTNEEIFLEHTGNYPQDDSNYTEFTVVLSEDKQIDFGLSKDHLETFMVICYLVCVKEVSRRLASQEYYLKEPSHLGKELPFATALLRSLILLADGNIRINQLFAPNSDYGVSTGKEITKFINEKGEKKLKETKGKFNKLNQLFFAKFSDEKTISANFTSSFFDRLGFNYNMPKFNKDLIQSIDEWSDDDDDGRPTCNPNYKKS